MDSWNKELVNYQLEESKFILARRRTYLNINLDTLTKNVSVLKGLCAGNTAIIAVVKGNAYGHGSVEVSRHLAKAGIYHFAVATPWEGAELRKAGIEGFIQVLGNASEEDIPDLIEYDLVPTVGTLDFLKEWSEQTSFVTCNSYLDPHEDDMDKRRVVIKVDTGMSRNGCQPSELETLVNFCDENNLGIHSIMTHFSSAWDNPDFTQLQLDTFLKVALPYRHRGIKLHVANSAGVLRGYGTDLDFVRPGIAMYGLPPDTSKEDIALCQRLGLKPVLSWIAKPTMVKTMHESQTVGYDNTYRCKEGDIVGTIPLGYADGYNRLLSARGILISRKGIQCPVVGRVSMDAITIKLSSDDDNNEALFVIKDDFTSANSVVALANQLGTITYEVTTSLAARLARVFTSNGNSYLSRRGT